MLLRSLGDKRLSLSSLGGRSKARLPHRVGSVLCGPPRYRDPAHAAHPHILKFSGGRSSAAMLLSLARGGFLHADRGDVVLFANTSAEHPLTYEFARRVCDEVEEKHGIPCFWYEFCSVESASWSGWTRKASYRLVRRDYSHDQADSQEGLPGYRQDGSVFEEFVSRETMLPNRHMRICTQQLKVAPGLALISEWLGGGPGPAADGNPHPDAPLISAASAAGRSQQATLGDDQYRDWVSASYAAPPHRDAQTWQDFTDVPLAGRSPGARPKADLSGAGGTWRQWVSLLGIRHDEPDRIAAIYSRALLAEDATGTHCRSTTQPAGELIYTPLDDHSITQAAVLQFWRDEPYDLDIPADTGNCVGCFMKGSSAISRLAREQANEAEEPLLTPGGGAARSHILVGGTRRALRASTVQRRGPLSGRRSTLVP